MHLHQATMGTKHRLRDHRARTNHGHLHLSIRTPATHHRPMELLSSRNAPTQTTRDTMASLTLSKPLRHSAATRLSLKVASITLIVRIHRRSTTSSNHRQPKSSQLMHATAPWQMHMASQPTHISPKEPATRNQTLLKAPTLFATGRLLQSHMTTLQLMPDKKPDSTIKPIQVLHSTTVQNYLKQNLMTSVTISITPRKSTMISA